MICRHCEKEIRGEGISFCPFCGAKLEAAEGKTVSEEAEEWIRKAVHEISLPKRKIILEKAKEACPDSREIEWELLFIGTPDPKPPRGKIDFSIIKSWLLQIYRTPGEFSEEKRNAMRTELFEGAQLQRILAASEDPDGTMRKYLLRLCREYIQIFLKEDNRLMGNLFGFRIGRDREKALENAVRGMIQQMEADDRLTPERKQMLCETMRQALES